ncbi:MAG: PEP-CTERM sorting domain-containing protein [Pseudomonadota bacterium]
MKKLLTMAAAVAASFGIANAVILDFEDFAAAGGLVNVNPLAPYFEDGFTVDVANGESAVFDSTAATDMLGNSASDFFGFSENNEVTIVRDGGGRFDLVSVLAGPTTLADDTDVTFTVVGVFDFVTSSFGASSFTVNTATLLPVVFSNIEALIIFASDDAAIDNVDLSPNEVPVPAALPLFGAAAAGFAALRRRRKALS